MSKVKIDYSGFMDTYPVAATTVTTGWYPGNIGNVATDGDMVIYDNGTKGEYPLFMIIDAPTELASPPSGDRVTCLYGQAKVDVEPDDVSDWTNVYIGPLASWVVNGGIWVTTTGKLTPTYNATPGTASGSMAVGKIIEPPTATNGYTLTMGLTRAACRLRYWLMTRLK